MQIVRPDTWPMIGVFIILILIAIGMIGLILVYFGISAFKKKKSPILATALTLIGSISLGFVIFNWIGYHQIYYNNSIKIIGVFKSHDSTIEIRSDHTWVYKGHELDYNTGTWDYEMSEDWCYWTIESENRLCHTQTGNPNLISFHENGIDFIR